MKYKLSKRSRNNLKHVHPDLILVVGLAITYTEIDFGVIEGIRTKDRQKELVDSGDSKTMNSRHLANDEGICFAVDLAAYLHGTLSWAWDLYEKIAIAMKRAARELGISIEWGGDWNSFKDGVHFQLPRKLYK